MITLSLCMIVKNEENTLERCLNSVRDIVDEIVIVDTGSTDRTKCIAEKYTDKVFDFQWCDDFSKARNDSFSRSEMDYILWLDADDILLPRDIVKLAALKGSLPEDINVVYMPYNTGLDDQGNVVFSYYRERIVKRNCGFRWKEPVHEYLEIYGKTMDSDVCITHGHKKRYKSDRNIRIYERLLAEGKALSARGMYYYARELKDHGRLEDAAEQYRRFLDSGKGWIEDNIAACGEMAKCLLLLNDDKGAAEAMLSSFLYDVPRAELCCQLGYFFKDRRHYARAIFWFETALRLKKPERQRGFYQADCWGYIPNLECAACYDKLGEYETAAFYNDKAAEYRPDSPSVLFNRLYFKKLLNHSLKEGVKEDVTADNSARRS